MLKILAILTLISSFSALAQGRKLHCEATFNMDKVLETTVELSPKERNKSFGQFEGFEFFLSENKDEAIELQVLNNYDPSRSYATAKLDSPSANVQLSIWKREFLLEVKCTKVL